MGRRIATLATCNLNQWAMDFEGNLRRIKDSIYQAKARGATYRVGPELEVPGYGCEDHFLELDTVTHSWEVVEELLKDEEVSRGILVDIGMPVIHRGVMYNCRVFLCNGSILAIRPKLHLANDGNYRETRYFATWKHRGRSEPHLLPPRLRPHAPGGAGEVPFGDVVLKMGDALLAAETCEELFTPQAPHIGLALAGVEIISNGSGSHHQLRKLDTRLDLIRGATAKAGGVYLYANQRGCDGGRLYFDGCACIAVNGSLVAQGGQFGLAEVEVVTADVDLDEVVSYRCSISSLREQASSTSPPVLVPVCFELCVKPHDQQQQGQAQVRAVPRHPTPPMTPKVLLPEEEIAYGPACWLWDYLRRCGASGFLLPLSGGADSSSVAAIVGAMCQLVVEAVRAGDPVVTADVRRVAGYGAGEGPADARELAGRLLSCVYMGTVNSSKETRERAKALADQVGAYHLSLTIDTVVEAVVALFTAAVTGGRRPRFRAHGGTNAENLALQNIQARLRMVLAFLLAQLLPWARGVPHKGGAGWLLVLGSANVDECLRGYLTKYDCSSADINPIGSISKTDIRRFLVWAAEHLGYSELAKVEAAPPTAELEPIVEGQQPQLDEVDMGMSYAELSLYGRLRKVARAGPVAMYNACAAMWKGKLGPAAVATKVKDFFRYYSMNRHKATVLTPSYHMESYSPDDNRYDHRQFLYNVRWPWQFRKVDEAAARDAEAEAATEAAEGTASTATEAAGGSTALQSEQGAAGAATVAQ